MNVRYPMKDELVGTIVPTKWTLKVPISAQSSEGPHRHRKGYKELFKWEELPPVEQSF